LEGGSNPLVYRLQPKGSYNSMNSPTPTGRRLQLPDLHAPTLRKLRLPIFSNTNWKEDPTTFSFPFLPPLNIVDVWTTSGRHSLKIIFNNIIIIDY
jgi:hypothetical protein